MRLYGMISIAKMKTFFGYPKEKPRKFSGRLIIFLILFVETMCGTILE